MKKNGIYIVLIILAILIGYLILDDFIGKSMKKTSGNPYAYTIDTFQNIDPALIQFSEIKRIRLPMADPVAIDYHLGKLGIAYKSAIQMIDTTGLEIFSESTHGNNTGLSFSPDGTLFLGSDGQIHMYDREGNFLESWETDGENPIITSLAFKDNLVFAADAGGRRVYRYDRTGELLGSFDGTGRLEGDYGFILPSPYFDLEVDPDGELWVGNTGLLSIENYSDDGKLRAFWGKPSFDLEGFSGCCNPVHFAILPDGSFVTCEKGLIRIKLHKPSGEFDCVVAGPEIFEENAVPPDLAVDETGRIFVLDITRQMIRIFERNET